VSGLLAGPESSLFFLDGLKIPLKRVLKVEDFFSLGEGEDILSADAMKTDARNKNGNTWDSSGTSEMMALQLSPNVPRVHILKLLLVFRYCSHGSTTRLIILCLLRQISKINALWS
jgi:hypothetical protein